MAAHTDLEKYDRAKAHVGTLKVLCGHLIVFMMVIATLLAVSSSHGDIRSVRWLFIGWGLGVIGHVFLVISPSTATVVAWEENRVREEIAKR